MKMRFTLSSLAIVRFAEYGLTYDLSGLRRGLEVVIRQERGLSPSDAAPPDSLCLLAFTLAANPCLAAEWSEALLSRVAVFEDELGDTFSFDDDQYRVRITVTDNVVTDVFPLPKRAAAQHRG
ncbi:MAG: hypothetical protein JNJ46_30470 [Myxococcales bacterium]|nr:hypothetical protein [Myxococcales bacterium]